MKGVASMLNRSNRRTAAVMQTYVLSPSAAKRMTESRTRVAGVDSKTRTPTSIIDNGSSDAKPVSNPGRLTSKLSWGTWAGLYVTSPDISSEPLLRARRTVPIVMMAAEMITPYLRTMLMTAFIESGSRRFNLGTLQQDQIPKALRIISIAAAASTTAKSLRTVGFLARGSTLAPTKAPMIMPSATGATMYGSTSPLTK